MKSKMADEAAVDAGAPVTPVADEGTMPTTNISVDTTTKDDTTNAAATSPSNKDGIAATPAPITPLPEDNANDVKDNMAAEATAASDVTRPIELEDDSKDNDNDVKEDVKDIDTDVKDKSAVETAEAASTIPPAGVADAFPIEIVAVAETPSMAPLLEENGKDKDTEIQEKSVAETAAETAATASVIPPKDVADATPKEMVKRTSSNTFPPADVADDPPKEGVQRTASKTMPRRLKNHSTESLRAVPLPSIEECLFGIPRDITAGNSNTQEEHMVPLNLIRRVASQGIDDDDEQAGGSHRALTWRVLLGYLPEDRRQWKTVSDQERNTYNTFVNELFCVDERDLSGQELRGHHSKRHSNKKQKEKQKREDKDTNGQSKKERREERQERLRSSKLKASSTEEASGLNDEPSPTARSAIKFVDDDDDTNSDENSSNNSDSKLTSIPSLEEDDDAPPSLSDEASSRVGLETVDNNNSGRGRNGDDAANEKLSSSDLLHDDPCSRWNMSEREQKLLERLTNHEAVNQLLVKRDCKAWNNFLENATLLDEIRKDVNRTHPHLYFYLEPQRQLGARRYGALERILFVWAKLNKGVAYVQGMNEIVGTLYYVLANDFNAEWADHAEADTYSLFNLIMSEMRDIFVADMDQADTGLVGRMDNMQNLLHLHDPQMKGHLDDMGIDASYYAVRWLTTLLSREFLLPDTIRLWDSMFASTHKENFLRYVCVAMVLKVREDLLKADFSTALQLLQKYPSSSMDDLLDASRALWIYESQITMACLKGGLTLHQALQAIPPPTKVVMAFGLPGGVALTNREQLEQAGTHARTAVKNNVVRARNGIQTLSTAGQGIWGGARRFIKNRARATSNDEVLPEPVPDVPRRLPFRNLSFNRSKSAPLAGDDNPDTATATGDNAGNEAPIETVQRAESDTL